MSRISTHCGDICQAVAVTSTVVAYAVMVYHLPAAVCGVRWLQQVGSRNAP